MTGQDDQKKLAESVRVKIRAAFPDLAFTGPITGVDGNSAEELDEEQDLYVCLSGRKWSEIPSEVIERNANGYHLLTDEAFVAFLPAWLDHAITSDEVRQFVAYTFEPDDDPERWLVDRLRRLNHQQMEAVQALLAYCVEFEPSSWVKEHARNALTHVSTLMGDLA